MVPGELTLHGPPRQLPYQEILQGIDGFDPRRELDFAFVNRLLHLLGEQQAASNSMDEPVPPRAEPGLFRAVTLGLPGRLAGVSLVPGPLSLVRRTVTLGLRERSVGAAADPDPRRVGQRRRRGRLGELVSALLPVPIALAGRSLVRVLPVVTAGHGSRLPGSIKNARAPHRVTSARGISGTPERDIGYRRLLRELYLAFPGKRPNGGRDRKRRRLKGPWKDTEGSGST